MVVVLVVERGKYRRCCCHCWWWRERDVRMLLLSLVVLGKRKRDYRPLVFGGAEMVVGVPSLICHGYAVYDTFKCWRRAANKDVERGQTIFLFIQVIE